MYLLDADSATHLTELSAYFAEYMEPMLRRLEAAQQAGNISAKVPEVGQYLQVCRWPFRKLEYSFALEALLAHLRPGDRYLDSGCGVTPLAQVLAGRGIHVDACDSNRNLIAGWRGQHPESIYGVEVDYAVQDLTALSYPDAAFDAVSCISVLEHIPAPHDQHAIHELLRILKPGGLLVLTVDFAPTAHNPAILAQGSHLVGRVAQLVRSGNIREIGRGLTRKRLASQAIYGGAARHARSANQSFSATHLEEDLLPLLTSAGSERPSAIPFRADYHAVSSIDARHFWDLQPGLYQNQGERNVLPAAFVLQKAGPLLSPAIVSDSTAIV